MKFDKEIIMERLYYISYCAVPCIRSDSVLLFRTYDEALEYVEKVAVDILMKNQDLVNYVSMVLDKPIESISTELFLKLTHGKSFGWDIFYKEVWNPKR
jgi:hypothetical protein